MPVEIIAPTIVRFTFKHLLANSHAADCVIDVSVDEFASTRHDAVFDMTDNTRDAWQDNIMGIMGNTVNFVGGHFTDLDSTGGVSGDFSPNAAKPILGGVTNNQTTPNTAYLVRKHCSHTRRQRPGRMYLPGVDETVTDQFGRVTSSFITAANTRLNSFKSALTNVGVSVTHPSTTAWRVVHISGYDGAVAPGFPLGRPNAWDSSDVSAADMDSVVASMRRRNR